MLAALQGKIYPSNSTARARAMEKSLVPCVSSPPTNYVSVHQQFVRYFLICIDLALISQQEAIRNNHELSRYGDGDRLHRYGDTRSEARISRASDGLRQPKHGGKYVPSRNALSQSNTQKMFPNNGTRNGNELTPGNIRHFNKQKEDENKGISNLINVKEAPKAYS